jgi:glycosyltransferase involved in cell wall biosynthesis
VTTGPNVSLEVPAEVRRLAEERAAARRDRDWPTADRLRGEIEGAGWRIIDSGTRFHLEPAHPPTVAAGRGVQYGRSDDVPSLLDEPSSNAASVIVIAREDAFGALRAASAVVATAPHGTRLVVVADGVADDVAADLEALATTAETAESSDIASADSDVAAGREAEGLVTEGRVPEGRVEVIRTSAPLGHAAALNIGLRRSTGEIVIVLDASIEPTGDVISPLVAALREPSVAIAGPYGLVSPDLRRFEEVETGDAAAIEGYLMAFRRTDAAARMPLDERFRFYRNLDVWWSLALRDDDAGGAPRRAVVVPAMPLVRHEHVAWAETPPAERDRLSKRNFYRVLDRFGQRDDLAVSGADPV